MSVNEKLIIGGGLFPWFSVLAFIMGGCCSNAYALEMLVKDAPSSGNLITFCQFLLVSFEGLAQHITFKNYIPSLKERKIPLSRWFLMVILFASSSQINNMAFAFKIPMSLHIIFRSGSLISNMLMGVLILGKRYNFKQVTSILLVTIGIILATFATVNKKGGDEVDSTFQEQLVGIALLTLALILASLLGIVQEVTYKKYGKHWREGLFYTHFLSLPIFLIFIQDIKSQIQLYASSEPLDLSSFSFLGPLNDIISINAIPKLFIFLILNIATQYFCVSGVQRLSSMATALTLNLVLTVRKMVSIVFSVVYFKHPISLQFVVGTLAVLFGTLLYTVSNQKQTKQEIKDAEKKGN